MSDSYDLVLQNNKSLRKTMTALIKGTSARLILVTEDIKENTYVILGADPSDVDVVKSRYASLSN